MLKGEALRLRPAGGQLGAALEDKGGPSGSPKRMVASMKRSIRLAIKASIVLVVLSISVFASDRNFAATCNSDSELEAAVGELNRAFPPPDRVGLCLMRGLAEGSHYRPAERVIYLDKDQILEFVHGKTFGQQDDLTGTFLYVFLPEMGPPLQNIRVLPSVSNEVDTELQADCFAGFALQTGERGGSVTRRQLVAARTVVGLIGDPWLAHIVNGVPKSH